ncbi:MAG: valine--tRNA ligase [Candidatus Woesearchaeota archaeon]
MELPKKYKFKEIEEKWKKYWQDNNTYVSTIKGDKVFSVDTPPPTVSGSMHMGHAFSYAQGDFIVRFKRMTGHTIFYPFGTDDNGLPTEHLIEKTKKVRSKAMERPEFVKLCHETVKELRPSFIKPWVDLGFSVDFENAYSTISKDSIRVSQKSFIDLYHKDLAYRKETPSVWCMKCQTAIAQAEFENIQKKSWFHDIAFTDEDSNELIISTTRPELLPACVGLFAHPDDERYAHLIGKKAKVPLFDYEVPVLFDEEVDTEKGTGLMMVCTFGDKEDVEKWHKFGLDLRTVFTKTGKMNELAGKYEGMPILEARKAIVDDLKQSGSLKDSIQITHNTNVHDRCGTEIEFLKTPQWFINVMDHKDELVKAGDDIDWHPSHMKIRYKHWVENLNWDWCISRQRHFGVPFPVWYEKDTGKIIVAKDSDLPVDPTSDKPSSYEGDPENLVPETDVMDTWATSSVSPQIALGWGKTPEGEFNKAFPMTLRLQSHDIIRTWAFYTIIKAKYNHGSIPWKNVMISGFVLDKHGKKMSKSKGNAVDPVKIMDMYGADAVRHSASAVKLGEDIPFHEKYLQTAKKTITKLFNASKFAHMHLEDFEGGFDYDVLPAIDRWMVSRINKVVREATERLEGYEFSKARVAVEQFFWHEFCDYYLEMVKDRLYKPEIYGDESRTAGQMTLAYVLERVLKIFAPYLPFVTEEIYSWRLKQLFGDSSVHVSKWPDVDETFISEDDEKAASLACDIIAAVRQQKNIEQVSQKHPVQRLVIDVDDDSKALLESMQRDIAMTTSADEVVYEAAEDIELDNGLKLAVSLAPKEEE